MATQKRSNGRKCCSLLLPQWLHSTPEETNWPAVLPSVNPGPWCTSPWPNTSRRWRALCTGWLLQATETHCSPAPEGEPGSTGGPSTHWNQKHTCKQAEQEDKYLQCLFQPQALKCWQVFFLILAESCWFTCTDTRERSPGRSRGPGRWRSAGTGRAHTAVWWSDTRHWWQRETSRGDDMTHRHINDAWKLYSGVKVSF